MSKIIIGIDPGKKGFVCVLETYSKRLHIHSVSKLNRIANIVKQDAAKIYLEAVKSSPQMGVVSAFTFGEGFGYIQGFLKACGAGINLIRPEVWQRGLKCLTKGNKKVSLKKAKEIFPDNKEINIDNADSVLIAEYGRRHQILLEAQK